MPEINNLRSPNESGWDKTGVFLRQLKDAGRAATCGPLQIGLTAIFILVCLFGPISLYSGPAAPPRSGRDSGKISEAFARYVQKTDRRNNSELQGGTNLLWVDSLAEAPRKKAYADLRRGEIQLEQRSTQESGREIVCPACMIHHWEGLVFIPEA